MMAEQDREKRWRGNVAHFTATPANHVLDPVAVSCAQYFPCN